MWLGFGQWRDIKSGNQIEPTLSIKIIVTLCLILLLFLGFLLFKHQERQDERQIKQEQSLNKNK